MVRLATTIFLFSLLALNAQPEQFDRSIELMDASMTNVPGLARIGAPLLEAVKKTVEQIKAEGPKPTNVFSYWTQLRGYCTVLEAMPKGATIPQYEELLKITDATQIFLKQLMVDSEARLANPDRDQLGFYGERNRLVPAPSPTKPRVIFLGDSITEDWRLNEYFQNKDYINRGISGQITSQLLGRMRSDVLQLKPAAIIVQAGINDFGYGIAMDTIQGNFQMIADLARANGIKVILASMLPMRRDYDSDVNKKVRVMNDWLNALSKQRGYTFCDYASFVGGSDGRMLKDLSNEGKHPNAAGYRQLAPAAQACINRALGTR